MIRVLQGDTRLILPTLPDESVQCVVTSPPYWGLRDYGTASWEGGDPGCDHLPPDEAGATSKPTAGQRVHAGRFTGPTCWKCGAARKDQQIGLEQTFGEYLEHMVGIFEQVRRVLRPDGVLWLNMGDSYVAAPKGPNGDDKSTLTPSGVEHQRAKTRGSRNQRLANGRDGQVHRTKSTEAPRPHQAVDGLKPKNLIGQPWRLAFALQSAGWWLRSDIVWSKPNPMPESVLDRPTKAHEYLFLLTKSARYYYDADAIREPFVTSDGQPNAPDKIGSPYGQGFTRSAKFPEGWENGAEPHDAVSRSRRTMPPIPPAGGAQPGHKSRAGVSADGYDDRKWQDRSDGRSRPPMTMADREYHPLGRNARSVWTIATSPFPEAHFATFPPELPRRCITAGSKPGDLVLDPFAGAGTTLMVADRLGRDAVGIELSPEYVALIQRRLEGDAPLLLDMTIESRES